MMIQKGRLSIIIGVAITLTIIGVIFGLVWPPAQVQAGATLPPRDPTPISSDSDDDDDGGEPPGAHIELHTQPPQINLWSAVQWQDSDGNWHNVEGWQGSLDGNGMRRWWVSPRDFGKGPFRWLVSNGPNASPLGISRPFNLADGADRVRQVVVSTNP